jgi:hypothetical protein
MTGATPDGTPGGWTRPAARTGRSRCAAALAALLTVAAAPAGALTLAVTGGGLTEGVSFACPSGAAQCEPSSDFGFTTDSGVSGTIDITGTALTVSVQIGSARFEALSPSGLPGDVEAVDFTNVDYTGSATVSVTDVSGTLSALAFTAGTGAVAGVYSSEDAGSTPVDAASAFAVDTPLTNVNCLLVSGSGQCSLQFGRSGFALGLGGDDHDFVHFLNVNVALVPEPSTALLWACAGGWLAVRSRRRR